MSGEYIQSESIGDYWEKLKAIYESRSTQWTDLTKEQYDGIERSERQDSDNHLNEERLGKDSSVIDVCRYKYLPDRQVAYAITLKHKDGQTEEHYFQLNLKEEID